MNEQNKQGANARQEKGHTPKNVATNVQNDNNIIIKRGQGAYTARKLVSGKSCIHEMMGADKAGNNPYQHIKPLRQQGIIITMIPVPGTDYHEYTVADAVSRAKIKNALAKMNRGKGG